MPERSVGAPVLIRVVSPTLSVPFDRGRDPLAIVGLPIILATFGRSIRGRLLTVFARVVGRALTLTVVVSLGGLGGFLALLSGVLGPFAAFALGVGSGLVALFARVLGLVLATVGLRLVSGLLALLGGGIGLPLTAVVGLTVAAGLRGRGLTLLAPLVGLARLVGLAVLGAGLGRGVLTARVIAGLLRCCDGGQHPHEQSGDPEDDRYSPSSHTSFPL